MLKKAGLAMAVATAGVLALSPLAFAADDDNGFDKGNVIGEHNGEDVCNKNIHESGDKADCTTESVSHAQHKSQHDSNDD